MTITMSLKPILFLVLSFLLFACDQQNLKTPNNSSSETLDPSTPSTVPASFQPKDIPMASADAIINGKMYFKDSQAKFYNQVFGKIENGQVIFIDSDIDFLDVSQTLDYQNIYPDRKGGFYIQSTLQGINHLLYLDKNGKIDTKVTINLSAIEGFVFVRPLECYDCPSNEIYLVSNIGTLYLINTDTHSLSLVDMTIKTCGTNNSFPSSCIIDSTWRQNGATNLGNYSRLANGRYLYYKTNFGEYIYVNGQFYTGFVLIDLIKKQVANLDFNFENSIGGVWTTINNTQYNAIKIYNETDSNEYSVNYPVLAMNVSTFAALSNKRIRITLANGVTNTMNLSNIVFWNNKILFDFEEGFYIKPQSFSMNICTESSNSDRVTVKAKNSSRRCYEQANNKLTLQSYGSIGTNTLQSSTKTKIWETPFEISDLNYFKYGSPYIHTPLLHFDHAQNLAYFLGRTNYPGFENKSALYKINLTDGSVIDSPIQFDSKGKFSSGSIIMSGNYFIVTNLVRNSTGLLEVDPKTGAINNIDFTFKLGGIDQSFGEAVKQLLPIGNNKLLISGTFDTVNNRPSQGFFIYDTEKKQVEYSSHTFSNNTYNHPICDVDGLFQYYQLMPVITDNYSNTYCGYNNPQYFKFHYINKTIYITGHFDLVDGKTRYGIAAIDESTDTVNDFHPIPSGFSPPTSFTGNTDSNLAHAIPNVIADLMLLGSGSSKYLFLYGDLHTSSSNWTTTSTGFRLNPTTGSQLNQVVMPSDFYTNFRYRINDSIVATIGINLIFYDMTTGLNLSSWIVNQDLYNQGSYSNTYIRSVASYKDYVFVGIAKRYNHYGATLLLYKINNGDFEFVKDLSSFVPKSKAEEMTPINGELGYDAAGARNLQLVDNTLIITSYAGSKAVSLKDLGL